MSRVSAYCVSLSEIFDFSEPVKNGKVPRSLARPCEECWVKVQGRVKTGTRV